MMNPIVIESCIETFDEAMQAAAHGATQLEVCSHLELDGLTPSISMVQDIVNQCPAESKIMIRSRGGNFEYSPSEMNEMYISVAQFKYLPIAGFVFGATKKTNDGLTSLDIANIKNICQAAYPMPMTIHKAIDICDDILAEIPKLKKIRNVKFILTSGGAKTASEGAEILKKMQALAYPEIQIIAAGKITKQNLPYLHDQLGLGFYHGKKIV